ncbi:MAG: hypothetical protein LBF87_03445 [Treponema sp.]|nr:hypothetical protein [Treponema sp.]
MAPKARRGCGIGKAWVSGTEGKAWVSGTEGKAWVSGTEGVGAWHREGAVLFLAL